MITCKYCGQELKFVGEYEDLPYFNCSFCEIIFSLDETGVDRKRKMSVPNYYDDSYYVPTRELLKRDTISLYHVLKDVRKAWYDVKTALENLKVYQKEQESSLPKPQESDNDLIKNLKREFIDLSKRRFSIENIILERTGYLPEKITEEFLNEIVEKGRKASNQPMFVYIK
ncbi:hypothetical protein G3M81_22840 [Bacillus paralicheniformis]|uniref:hypothetical protein n=1 Tax=Bacillus TaxID=1386 RepID=UPI0013EED830|nr:MULTISPECIES: hypothetical protein [Bacillus]QII26930.1 hypothetical protein G3M80_20750 [Bacillus altitudinis]QII51398.1 hypothetical protein G3M81_22840 [Bacillus paralicheniformis]